MMSLTPKQIVEELDKYIVGQTDAKRAVAVAIRNRWRRQQLPANVSRDVMPKNIIMVGPTGVGKTEIARRMATIVNAPFIKVEATKFTEVGYHGRDVDSIIRDLVDVAVGMARDEMERSVADAAQRQAEDRLLDLLLGGERAPSFEDEEAKARRQRTREKMREQLRAGELDDREVEVQFEQKSGNAAANLFQQAGLELDQDMAGMFERMLPTRRETRRVRVADAWGLLAGQEAGKLVDDEAVRKAAVERVEQSGIVFLDEIDKIAGSDAKNGPDVSRQGVQRDLLPIVEGSTVTTKYGPVKTDHILFIAAGAFSDSEPDDLMPELQGRFPIRVELLNLSKDDFVRILKEPENSLLKQQVALLAADGVAVEFTDDAVEQIARAAFDANRKTQNLGARRLHAVLEQVLEDVSFDAPDSAERHVRVNADYVRMQVRG